MNFAEFLSTLTTGEGLALIGAALAAILPGIGSAKAVGSVGESLAGLLSEDPSKFGKAFLLQALPATQGIYGFVLAVMKIGAIAQGWNLFGAMIGLGVTGMLSAILQGITASSCIYAIGKNSAGSGKYVLFPAMIEFYAILSLVLGIMIPVA